jgi:predicted CXXCH cytochrome family protein
MSRRRIPLRVLGALVCLIGFASTASALDTPHDEFAGIYACNPCHSAHSGSYPHQLATLCEQCHFDGGPATSVKTHSSVTTSSGYGDWHLQCWGCHNPHKQEQDIAYATTYGQFLYVDLDADVELIDPNDPTPEFYEPIGIIRTVTGTAIEHTSTTSFVDGDPNSIDDICQACHEQTLYYNPASALNVHTDYGPDSQPGGDCVGCHPHGDGFSPGGCGGCHAVTQPPGLDYRRQVTQTGGDFERASHHVTDGTATEIVTDADCQVCHDQLLHQTNPEPTVVLNDADGGASHTYDGAGASLETFCVSCHDADGSLAYDVDGDTGNGYQPFGDGRDPSDIATGWAAAAHNAAAPAALADDACMACHGGPDSTRSGLTADQNAHGSDQVSLLSELVNGALVANVEEDLCYACHDGLTAATDIESEFAKGTNGSSIFHHPVQRSGQSAGRSVECTDCHDPHYATAADPLFGAGGVDPNGNPVPEGGAVEEYEVCFGCHADGPGKPPPSTSRQFPEGNTRLEFNGAQTSFHTVIVAGTLNPNVPSLYNGWTTSSVLDCTSCHNNDSGPGAGGSGPNGPHGSIWPSILERRFETSDSNPYTEASYALCFKCHDPNVILDSGLSFEDHDRHVDNEESSCNVCHDPHGSSGQKFLINFDTSVVFPDRNGRLEFIAPEDSGDGRGYCYLDCHGRDHSPRRYNPNY